MRAFFWVAPLPLYEKDPMDVPAMSMLKSVDSFPVILARAVRDEQPETSMEVSLLLLRLTDVRSYLSSALNSVRPQPSKSTVLIRPFSLRST